MAGSGDPATAEENQIVSSRPVRIIAIALLLSGFQLPQLAVAQTKAKSVALSKEVASNQASRAAIRQVLNACNYSYPCCMDSLPANSAPLLLELLKSPDQNDVWNNAIYALSYQSLDNSFIAPVREFLKADVPWDLVGSDRLAEFPRAKLNAISLLGIINTSESHLILEKILTDSTYARGLLGDWIEQGGAISSPFQSDYAVVVAMNQAAIGLAYSKKAERLKNQKASLVRCIKTKESYPPFSGLRGNEDLNYLLRSHYQFLTRAITYSQIIDESGLVGLFKLMSNHEDCEQRIIDGYLNLKHVDGVE